MILMFSHCDSTNIIVSLKPFPKTKEASPDMKQGIHPEYKEIKVVLSDGSEIQTRSTMKTTEGVYKTEIDSKNHPFYTNKAFTAKAGRVDRFKRMYDKKK